MIRHLAGIAWHIAGMFVLPFLVGFVAALFFEVSEVGETLPVLLAVAALLILPAFAAQLLGLVLKVRRERILLRERGQASWENLLASVHRHARVVTPRGWVLLWSGIWFVVCALGLKWASLSVVAVAALLLFYGTVGAASFVSTFLMGSFQSGLRRRGSISRQMAPAVVLAGEPAEERFTISRVPVPPGFFLLVEDPLPARLQTTSRYAVGAGAKREELVVGGRVRATPRGLYQLGPAEVYYQDILGVTRVALASLATAELKVLPRFRNLEIVEPPRSRLEAPDVVARPHRFPTEDHFRFREYIAGDDTRRIQWKLSMKTGRLQVRQPESREQSTRTVVLVLDTFLLPGQMLSDAIGLEDVLDRLVEVWISLARELTDRGDRVSILAMGRRSDGVIETELIACRKGGHVRWQDLGARVVWQGTADVGQLLAGLGKDQHAVVVSSRFLAPPPQPFAGESLTWVWLPPLDALGSQDPALLKILSNEARWPWTWFLRQPFPAGSDENALLAQFRDVSGHLARAAARSRLRGAAQTHGEAVFRALVARGDAVYRIQAGAGTHRLVGVSAGRNG